MLFLTLFFELRLVARTRFSRAILSPSVLHTFTHRGSAHSHTQAAIGQVFLWNIYANFLLFIICLIYLLTPSHTHTQCQWKQKKKPTKILKDHCASIARTHTLACTKQSHIQRFLPASFWVWRSPHDGDDETTTTTRTHVNAADNTRLSQPFRTRAQNKLKAQAKTTKQMQRSQLGWQRQSRVNSDHRREWVAP